MKLAIITIRIILTIPILFFIFIKLFSMSIFIEATKSGWYTPFLEPVVQEISTNKNTKHILDIGTGPGNLPQMLIQKDQSLQITGIDIDSGMIAEANSRNSSKNINFEIQKKNEPLQFKTESFDAVSFCSVLFLLNDSTRESLVDEAFRVMKPNGKLVILTPSGKKPVASSLVEMWQYPFSFRNYSFVVWKFATTSRARKWKKADFLKKYAKKHELSYKKSLVFNENAVLEVVYK